MVERPDILPVTLSDVTVHKRGKTILDGLSLQITSAGPTLVMGPNGSGKSTLLRLLHGMERPRSGDASWAIEESLARAERAFVFQTPVMLRRSVLDNIAYPLRLRGSSRSKARDTASRWVERTGLTEAKERDALFLSGGERQKLAIARALVTQPRVLFLDEPTANLDGRSTHDIESLLQSVIQDGTKIIMATHDIGQARRLAHDVVFLNDGRLCEYTPADRFFDRAETEEARTFLKGGLLT